MSCAVFAAALAVSAPAPASYIHPFVKTFGSFSVVQGIAADSTTGDVYVYDGGQASIFKFNAAGEPADFSAHGTNAIKGVDYLENGTAGLAVDNSSGPAKGDIYVATVGNGTPIAAGEERFGGAKIGIYRSTGEMLGELHSESLIGNVCGVAVDSAGDLYVSAFGKLAKYAPKANPVTEADYVSSLEGLSSVCQTSVDSLGSVFGASWRLGPLKRYEASQFGSSSATGAAIDQEGASVAIDPSNDEVYANDRTQVTQYGAHGEPFEAPVSTFDTGRSAGFSVFGIAVSGYNHDVYVSNGGNITIFGPLGLVATVETGATSNVQTHSTTVSGTVDPEGLAVSDCKVEYGPSTAYGSSQPCAQSPAQIGAGPSPVAVQANLTGLVPGTVYHYRVVAVNANGRGEGVDRSVALAGPPALTGESFSNLEETEASVRAQIDPDFRSTTYRVDYGTSTAYGQSTPESPPVGSDSATYNVLVHLAGLAPGTTYHFRFVATNELGVVYGEDARFTTFSAPPGTLPAAGGGSSPEVPAGGVCSGSQCETGLTTTPAFSPVRWEVAKARPKALTRAQKLVRALKACRRKHGKARRHCEAKARKRDGASRSMPKRT